MIKEIETANDVLNLPAEEAKQWINEVWSGKRKVDNNFNWHGMAEVAGDYGTSEKKYVNGKPNLKWTEISVSIYEKLAMSGNSKDYRSFMPSAMQHRAWAITRHGERKGDYILDPDIIVRWFFNDLKLSYEEALKKSLEFRSLKSVDEIKNFDIELLRELKNIKIHLSPIKWLVENSNYKPSEELAKWLEIRTKLP